MEHSAVGWTAWRSKRTVSERQTHMATNFTKKTAAIALAAGLAFSGSAGAVFAPVASAQSLTDINKAKVCIKIHKKVGAKTHGNPNPDGSAVENVDGQPLAGAKFTLRKLNYDLSKEADFAEAAKLQKTESGLADIPENRLGEVIGTRTTDASGLAAFDNIPAGAYLVTEEPPADADGATYIPSAPFIVFAPMATTDNKWNRVVHVYPKNTELKAVKEVKDKGKNPIQDGTEGTEKNNVLEYSVTSPVPYLPPNRKLTELSAVDIYKAGDFVNGLNIDKVEIVRADGTRQALDANQYTVANGTEEVVENGKVVADTTRTVTVNDKAIIDSLKGGDKLVVTLKGEVRKIQQNNEGEGIEDGEVTNFARTTGKTKVTGQPGSKDKPEEPFETPKTRVESYFAAVRVIKFEKGEEGKEKKLDGAVFDVYSVPATAACTDTNNRTMIKKDFKVSGGEAVINGLHVTDFVDGKAVTPGVETNKFCIVETAAPSGYSLDTTPHELTVLKADAQNPKTENKLTFSSTAKVENKKRPQFELPQTGGMGVAALILAGLALLGGGAFAARRKNA
ncbi:hypothetical protein CJ203_02970 [Corynebacterium tuscaniense]|uniref:Gram-positive cocci surface proteins LPxTG domain-containing protein n=2 Tax=Corynebacterium tuscaniense TaxID=302449 RepID=A0A2N6T6P2_9CORY|nr:hypothetical protein CJ203_02970 [Corynebacterium tuscaniense]